MNPRPPAALRGPHGLKAGLLAGALAVAPLPAAAQQFSFDRDLYVVRPGETLVMDILASGARSPVGAAHFAVRIAEEDAGDLIITEAVGFPGEDVGGFSLSDNSSPTVAASPATPISGPAAEYRAVLLGEGRLISLMGRSHVATVSLPVSQNAEGRYLVVLPEASGPGGRPLLGLYGQEGQPMAAAGRSMPAGDAAMVLVHDGLSPIETDFAAQAPGEEWLFRSPADRGIRGVYDEAEGFGLRAEARGVRGWWRYNSGLLGPWQSIPRGSFYRSIWSARLPEGGLPAGWSLIARVEDAAGAAVQEIIRPASALEEMSGQMMLLAAENGTGTGLVPSFGMVSGTLPNPDGEVVWLETLTEDFPDVPPVALGTPYVRVFSSGVDGGWEPDMEVRWTDEVRFVNSANGIGLRVAPHEGGVQGSWRTPPGVFGVFGDQDVLFRLEADLIGAAEAGALSPAGRLRVSDREFRWISSLTVPPAPPGERTVRTWFAVPEDLDGAELQVSFDVLDPDPRAAQGELFLKSLEVESYSLAE